VGIGGARGLRRSSGLIGAEVRTMRLRAAKTELVRMNRRIGRLILERKQIQPSGSAVIPQLAADLRREFPDITGLSATNLQYMRAFAAAWTTEPISPQPVGKLPWGHVRTVLDQLDDPNLVIGTPSGTSATAGPGRSSSTTS